MEDKLKILFVDDEENILSGLKRTFRGKRDAWDMDFCVSGKDALEQMSKAHYDFIVTDMKMPEMSGGDLLEIVSERHPDTVRVVLSGYAERELMLKTIMSAHQYLHKPCVPEMLLEMVERASKLRGILRQERVRALIKKIKTVPSIPDLYSELMEALGEEDVSMDRIEDIIMQDMGMTSKMLQVVNSAYFSIPYHVTNLREAITILGFDVVRSLVMGSKIFEEIDPQVMRILPTRALWDHALFTAMYAKKIAQDEDQNPAVADHCFMGGLLSKVGIIILATNFTDEYKGVIERVRNTGELLHEVEREVFGSHHGELGGYLLSLWGLPDPILEAVVFHATPNDCSSHSFLPLTTVHVAGYLATFMNQEPEWFQPKDLDRDYVERLNLDEKIEKWSSWQEDDDDS